MSKKILIKTSIKSLFDPVLLIPIILSAFGVVIVASATRSMPGGGVRTVIVQIIGAVLGLMFVLIFSRISFRTVKHFGAYIFLVSFILLVLVLLIGTGEQYGSKSWIRFGFVGFQPAETVKLFFIVICAIFLERIYKKQNKNANYIKLFIYSGVIVLLVLLQKDFGMAAVFIFIFILMLFMAGIDRKILLAGIVLLITAIPFSWYFLLNDARKNRIKVFLNPEMDPLNAGFNVIQSKLAIGSGRITGQGLFGGYLNSRGLVPVKESDFIFAVVGEEFGFLGAVAIILLFLMFLLSILKMAKNARDTFDTMVCYGIFAMFAFHFIQNVSMTIGLLPVTGLPLPFISAGGTAVLSYFMAVGILVSISRDNKSTQT